MAVKRIDQAGHQSGNDQIAVEAHALGNGTRDNRHRRAAKNQLEEEEREQPSAGVFVRHETAEANPAAQARPKHQRKTEQPEEKTGQRDIDDIFDDHIDRVLCTNQPAFQTCEAALHHQHEHRADDQPENVDKIAFAVNGCPHPFHLRRHTEAERSTLANGTAKTCTRSAPHEADCVCRTLRRLHSETAARLSWPHDLQCNTNLKRIG